MPRYEWDDVHFSFGGLEFTFSWDTDHNAFTCETGSEIPKAQREDFVALFALMRDTFYADDALFDPRESSYDAMNGVMRFTCASDCDEDFMKPAVEGFIQQFQDQERITRKNANGRNVPEHVLRQDSIEDYRKAYDIPSTVTVLNLPPLGELKASHPLTDQLLTWVYQHDLTCNENMICKDVNAIIDVIEKYNKSRSSLPEDTARTQRYKESVEGSVTTLVKRACVADSNHKPKPVIAEIMTLLDDEIRPRGPATDGHMI